MRKFSVVVLIFVLSLGAFAQRGKSATVSADDLSTFCTTYLAAFAPGTGDTYKDRKELIQSTRCWNYVSGVMDESAGAHWDTSTGMSAPVVKVWQWDATTTEVIQSFVAWANEHAEHGSDPANIAIKEASVAKKLYVPAHED
jgi:hypothetical protein